MVLNETVVFAFSTEEAERILNDTNLMALMREAKPEVVKKVSLSGYTDTRAVYVLGNPRIIRILDNLIRDP